MPTLPTQYQWKVGSRNEIPPDILLDNVCKYLRNKEDRAGSLFFDLIFQSAMQCEVCNAVCRTL